MIHHAEYRQHLTDSYAQNIGLELSLHIRNFCHEALEWRSVASGLLRTLTLYQCIDPNRWNPASYTSIMPLSLKLPKFLDLVAVVQSIFLKQQEPQGPVGPAIDQFPPSSSISQVNFIPRNILAFRLITKTLARIASTHPFTAIDNLSDTNTGWQSSERHEVKVSDAFAHLAVAEHDIVAISTNYRTYFRSLEAKDPKTDSTLGVMACSTPDNVENLDTTTSSGIMPYGQGILAAATKAIKFKVLASKNDQNTDPKNLVPIIIKPVRPGDFGDGSLNDYMKDLETNWYLLFCSLIANICSHPYIVGASHHCRLIYGS